MVKEHEDGGLRSGPGVGANFPGGLYAVILSRSMEVSQNLLLRPQAKG